MHFLSLFLSFPLIFPVSFSFQLPLYPISSLSNTFSSSTSHKYEKKLGRIHMYRRIGNKTKKKLFKALKIGTLLLVQMKFSLITLDDNLQNICRSLHKSYVGFIIFIQAIEQLKYPFAVYSFQEQQFRYVHSTEAKQQSKQSEAGCTANVSRNHEKRTCESEREKTQATTNLNFVFGTCFIRFYSLGLLYGKANCSKFNKNALLPFAFFFFVFLVNSEIVFHHQWQQSMYLAQTKRFDDTLEISFELLCSFITFFFW